MSETHNHSTKVVYGEGETLNKPITPKEIIDYIILQKYCRI